MRGNKAKANKVGLVACHVLGVREPANEWIIDSGATCHICNSRGCFEEFRPLSQPQKVTLGDGRSLEAIGMGVVEVKLMGSQRLEGWVKSSMSLL